MTLLLLCVCACVCVRLRDEALPYLFPLVSIGPPRRHTQPHAHTQRDITDDTVLFKHVDPKSVVHINTHT